MKKRFLIVLTLLASINLLFSQETAEELEIQEETPTRPVLSLPELKFLFDEGVSYCQVTRIEKMDNRSNFVRENMMIGPYFNMQTVDFSFFDFVLNLSAYYPFYQAFNGMPQKPRNMFNYAINGFFGITGTYNHLKFVELNMSLGMHYMYQLTDEWYMNYLGIGGCLGLKLPVTKNWSIVNNNYFSYDNANLGNNKNIQPFAGSYQYQIDLGISFSKKVLNKYYYIDTDKRKNNKNKEAN